MKGFLFALELTLVAMAPIAGNASDPIPPAAHWNVMLDTAQYRAFYARPAGVGTDQAVWTVWHKVEFKVPPPSELAGIASLVLQVEMNCHLNKVAILRTIEYSKAGKVISDISVDPVKAQYVEYDVKPSTTFSLNSILVDLAYSDYDDSCSKGE